MGKATLHLYIDHDLKELAKKSTDIKSISAEFESWLKFRLKQTTNNTIPSDEDLSKEIAIQKVNLKKLEDKAVSVELEDQREKVRSDIVELLVKKEIEYRNNPLDRIEGLQFIFKSKLNEVISYDHAKELIEKEIERMGEHAEILKEVK